MHVYSNRVVTFTINITCLHIFVTRYSEIKFKVVELTLWCEVFKDIATAVGLHHACYAY